MVNKMIPVFFSLVICVAATIDVQAQNNRAPHPSMTEDVDGDLKTGEYIVVSPNGSITRALCPYTCEMRGLPPEHCKTWPSKSNPSECYIQDTRIASEAVEPERNDDKNKAQ